jgi:ribonucleoside-diphosphate reductase beta chain
VYLLSRLVAEHGEGMWEGIQRRMEELLPVAIGVIPEIFARYQVMPFGLRIEEFTDFAMQQFQYRFARIERARSAALSELDLGDVG